MNNTSKTVPQVRVGFFGAAVMTIEDMVKADSVAAA
jgi:hypothetical protein